MRKVTLWSGVTSVDFSVSLGVGGCRWSWAEARGAIDAARTRQANPTPIADLGSGRIAEPPGTRVTGKASHRRPGRSDLRSPERRSEPVRIRARRRGRRAGAVPYHRSEAGDKPGCRGGIRRGDSTLPSTYPGRVHS